MAIVSDNWAELLLPGLRTIFDKHKQGMKDFVPVLFNVETSTKAQEFNLGVGSLGLMDEWAGSVSYEEFNKGFKATYTHKKYSKGIQLERELVDDDQYAEIKKRVRMLSQSVYYTRQIHAASVFNYAFSASRPGPDGVALCSASHPNSPTDAGVQGNAGSTLLDADAVETTRNLMKAWTDDKGNLLYIEPDTIVVPPNLRKTATIIAETKEEPFTTDHGVNIWAGGSLRVIELPFLSDSNNWFMVDSSRMKLFLQWYDRRKADFSDDVEFDTEVAKYKVVARFSYGFDDWSWLYGHAVS